MPIHIAFGVDRAFLRQVAVTIASILAHAANPSDLRFHVLHSVDEQGFPGEIEHWGLDHVQLVPLHNPFRAEDGTGGRITVSSYLRTLIPEALPHLERVLYLDADIIVQHDIAELYRSDLQGRPMGGVLDLGVYMLLGRGEVRGYSGWRDYFMSVGFDPSRLHYVNTGMLLMELEPLRRLEFGRRALQMSADRGHEVRFGDQCITNAVLMDQIALLEPRWNVLANTAAFRRRHHYLPAELRSVLRAQVAEPWIIHFSGDKKPWNSAETWRADAWWDHADNTWPRPEPTLRSRLRALASRFG